MPPGYSAAPRTQVKGSGIRAHTGSGDTVWQPILNLYDIAQVYRLSAVHCQMTQYSQMVPGYLIRYSVSANQISFDTKTANQIVSFKSG